MVDRAIATDPAGTSTCIRTEVGLTLLEALYLNIKALIEERARKRLLAIEGDAFPFWNWKCHLANCMGHHSWYKYTIVIHVPKRRTTHNIDLVAHGKYLKNYGIVIIIFLQRDPQMKPYCSMNTIFMIPEREGEARTCGDPSLGIQFPFHAKQHFRTPAQF